MTDSRADRARRTLLVRTRMGPDRITLGELLEIVAISRETREHAKSKLREPGTKKRAAVSTEMRRRLLAMFVTDVGWIR